ncbi:MAG: hypothetical protein ABI539_13220 [Acidobacteriota bacterium]
MSFKILIVTILTTFALACSNAGTPVEQNTNSGLRSRTNEKPQTAIAHGPEMKQPETAPGGAKSKWSQGGDAVDTSKEDAAITAAEKTLREKPSDPEAKRSLGAAFFKRATLLTESRQYASALGDYRRAIKNDPSNTEAKEWIDRIISIYASINKESPKEGEEPPPLPLSKGS